jgi:hypothetical protein
MRTARANQCPATGVSAWLAAFAGVLCVLCLLAILLPAVTYVDARISAAELLHARPMKLSVDCSMGWHAANLCESVNLKD